MTFTIPAWVFWLLAIPASVIGLGLMVLGILFIAAMPKRFF